MEFISTSGSSRCTCKFKKGHGITGMSIHITILIIYDRLVAFQMLTVVSSAFPPSLESSQVFGQSTSPYPVTCPPLFNLSLTRVSSLQSVFSCCCCCCRFWLAKLFREWDFWDVSIKSTLKSGAPVAHTHHVAESSLQQPGFDSSPGCLLHAIPALSPPSLSFLASASTIQKGWKQNKPPESYTEVTPADPDKNSRWTTATFKSISCLHMRHSLTGQYYASLTCILKPPNMLGANGLERFKMLVSSFTKNNPVVSLLPSALLRINNECCHLNSDYVNVSRE